jgi:hypothetical protein
MATHDYVIDNQSASAFRTDLNNALQAILTQNSSATAPATTAANMIWYDTANDQIKKRNEANSAWITLGTIDEGAGTFTPTGQRALSSQAQAEAGTDNTTVMTPLRVAQAVAVLSPAYVDTVLLGTLTTTSGSTQTLSGLVLTPYKFIFMTFNVVSMSGSTYFRVGGASGPASVTTASASATLSGHCNIDLQNGVGSISTAESGASTKFDAALTGFTNASTSVSITVNTGTFDAGSVRIYGVK